jgi:hypothetical protein
LESSCEKSTKSGKETLRKIEPKNKKSLIVSFDINMLSSKKTSSSHLDLFFGDHTKNMTTKSSSAKYQKTSGFLFASVANQHEMSLADGNQKVCMIHGVNYDDRT